MNFSGGLGEVVRGGGPVGYNVEKALSLRAGAKTRAVKLPDCLRKWQLPRTRSLATGTSPLAVVFFNKSVSHTFFEF